jgi:hypothetical protein
MKRQTYMQLAWFVAMAALITRVAWKGTSIGSTATMVFYSCAAFWVVLKVVIMLESRRERKNPQSQ